MARILVVDDDQDQRFALVTMLEAAGHQAFETSDGNEAIDLHREGGLDVVITDLQMPEVHGLELIARLRDLSPSPRIIAVSGTGADQLSVAEALGARVTLTKPVFPDKLLGAVDEALAGDDAAPMLVVSDPPHRDVDLDAASSIIGLDIFQTRLKFIFPGPEVLAASDARRSAEIATTFSDAAVRLAMIEGKELAAVPWPDPVSLFGFTETGLTATLQDRAVTVPYDSPGIGVYCSPPKDVQPKRPSKSRAPESATSGLRGLEVVEVIERMANLDLYFRRGDVLDRISIVAELTDFAGLRSRQKGTAHENMETVLAECVRLFPRIKFDTRLEGVRPRRRFSPGDTDQKPDTRKRYSFGTSLLREMLESISPELSDLTQYELGSRLGYITTRERPISWRS